MGIQAAECRLFRPAAVLIATCSLLLSGTAGAERPQVHAIAGGTVIVEPGRRIEGGTVILRDGLIEAVGSQVRIPPDAVEIDATGLWVYPGLIDADSKLTFGAPSREGPTPPASGETSRPAARDTAPRGTAHPIARVHPEQNIADLLTPFEGDTQRTMEQLRELGITTVLASPADGILRGSGAAIQLAEDRSVPQLILRERVSQHATLDRSRGDDYPTSLMGAAAALRQTLHDAERYVTWIERYRRDPSGMTRPEVHAAYAALASVLSGEQPLIVRLNDPHDALLADRIGSEFELKLILSGSGHEWEIAEQIAATGRPLLHPLSFPEEPRVRDDDDALDVSRRTLRRYLEAPAAPIRLAEAGVRLALTTRALENTADFRKNMARIVAAGFDEDQALAAWTTTPASLLGLERILGTLEPGKIANLVLADGPLFAEKTRVTRVFVDGRSYKIEQPVKPQGDPDAVVDPRGDWAVVFDTGRRKIQRSWTIRGATSDYSGTAETAEGSVDLDAVELVGNAMTLTFPGRAGRGRMEVTVIITGERFEGTAQAGPREMTVRGTRTSGPEGRER